MGKSTSAQLLARDAGYVYYEADCFTQLKNPYIPLDTDNPSMAQVRQKPLRGPGAAERKGLYSLANDCFGAIMAGQQYDKAAFLTVYEAMAEDIRRERARIGGDWAVANVVISREIRDRMRWAVLTLDPAVMCGHCREILGPQLVFILLSMPSEDRRKRIAERHKDDETAVHMMDVTTTTLTLDIVQFSNHVDISVDV